MRGAPRQPRQLQTRRPPTGGRFHFRRDRLPNPVEYLRSQGVQLAPGKAEWASARCPFHDDRQPSLRIRLDSGGYRCMACGAHGGDVLAFHRQLHGMSFVQAARDLGAWEE